MIASRRAASADRAVGDLAGAVGPAVRAASSLIARERVAVDGRAVGASDAADAAHG